MNWDSVDLKGRVIRLEAQHTKDREQRAIPICDPLFDELKTIPRGIHGLVFRYKGAGVRDIDTAIATACRKAKITCGRSQKGGFTFHDLRHTFNTNMRKAGVPESVIMSITGHATREMFDRYNTIDDGDREKAIGQFKNFLEKC